MQKLKKNSELKFYDPTNFKANSDKLKIKKHNSENGTTLFKNSKISTTKLCLTDILNSNKKSKTPKIAQRFLKIQKKAPPKAPPKAPQKAPQKAPPC